MSSTTTVTERLLLTSNHKKLVDTHSPSSMEVCSAKILIFINFVSLILLDLSNNVMAHIGNNELFNKLKWVGICTSIFNYCIIIQVVL